MGSDDNMRPSSARRSRLGRQPRQSRSQVSLANQCVGNGQISESAMLQSTLKVPQGKLELLREAFDLIDQDSDGVIGRADLRATYQSLGLKFKSKELDGMLAEIKGPLTCTKFVSLLALKTGDLDDPEILLNAFRILDEDQDDKIQITDLCKQLMTVGYEREKKWVHVGPTNCSMKSFKWVPVQKEDTKDEDEKEQSTELSKNGENVENRFQSILNEDSNSNLSFPPASPLISEDSQEVPTKKETVITNEDSNTGVSFSSFTSNDNSNQQEESMDGNLQLASQTNDDSTPAFSQSLIQAAAAIGQNFGSNEAKQINSTEVKRTDTTTPQSFNSKPLIGEEQHMVPLQAKPNPGPPDNEPPTKKQRVESATIEPATSKRD
eukprot:gene18112-19921_t